MTLLRSLLPLSVFILSCGVHAAPKKPAKKTEPPPPASLREQALGEAVAVGVPTARATDAGVSGSGLLTLKDPGLAPADLTWKWLIGIRLQNMAPSGSATLANGQTFDLDRVGSTTYPIVELGLLRELGATENFSFRAGVRVEAGYATQATEVVYPSLIRADNTRLATGLASAQLTGGVRWHRLPKLELEAGLGQGIISTSQTATDDTVRFSRQSSFRTLSAGLLWWVKDDWALEAQQAQRSLSSSENIKIQTDNFSVGTRVTW